MKDNDFTSDYFEYLQFERGLSKNTIVAYQRDLQKFHDVCKKSAIESGPEEISTLLSYMHKTGQSARSQSRMLSSLRGFYNWAQEEKHITQNPILLFENPRQNRTIPVVLSEKEVQRILDVIPMNEQFSTRDKAMIELLYACGLRVSEACELKLSLLRIKDGYIIVTGKGNKQRLVGTVEAGLTGCNLWFTRGERIDLSAWIQFLPFLNCELRFCLQLRKIRSRRRNLSLSTLHGKLEI